MENENINPWLQLWTRPRATLRSILNSNPHKLILWLAIIGGIVSFLTLAAYSWYPPHGIFHYILLIVTVCVVGAIFGLIHLYFSGWLLKLTGSWIGGKGNFTEVKCAVGWSNYPFIIANIFSALSVIFTHNIWLRALFSLVNVVLLVWGLIIYLKLIGEAHQFSAWKAVLAFFIAIVLIFVALMLIALLVPLLSPLFQ